MSSLFDTVPERGVQAGAPLLVVSLAEPPIGKGRPRSRIVKPRSGPQFVSVYVDATTRAYEARLRAAGLRAMGGAPPLEGPLAVIVWAFIAVPASWSQKKRMAAAEGDVPATGKPDQDNIAKAVLDAFNTSRKHGPGVWLDDSQIVDGRTVKLYARRTPGIIIEIRRAGAAPMPWHFTQ